MGGDLTPHTDDGVTDGRSAIRATIRVGIAGCTGSIGTQTLDVIRAENARCPGSYRVTALGAGRSVATVVAQAIEFRPDVVVVTDAERTRRGGRSPPVGLGFRPIG